jgi:hypothetical protein
VTPVLVTPGKAFTEAETLPYATIDTMEARLDLTRQLLPASSYVFDISAVDREGHVSPPLRTAAMTW